MKYISLIAALGLGIVAQAPALANDLSITDVDVQAWNGALHCLPSSGCAISASTTSNQAAALALGHSFSGVGDSWDFDFAKIHIGSGFVGWDGSAQIEVDFSFDPTATGDTGDHGTGGYGTLFGFINGGVLSWDSNAPGGTPLTFSAGGATYGLHLDDLSGLMLGSKVNVHGEITMLSLDTSSNDTGDVPEPASWAMMLGGFSLIGGVMRSQRRKVSFA
jgi:hypothetical protein